MARVACSPVGWLGVRYEEVLDDVAGAGYAGVEAHAPALLRGFDGTRSLPQPEPGRGSSLGVGMEAFGRQPGALRALLEERQLTLTAIPFVGTFFEREQWKEELERLRRVADFLAEVSSDGTIVFRTVAHPARRDMVAGEPPLLPLDASRMGHLGETLNRYCDVCAGFGLRGALANRVGTFVETPGEVETLLDRTEPGLVWLAPDVGHWAYAGGDPAALMRTHRERILYPRLKGFDAEVFERIRVERLGFASFLRAGGFADLDTGTAELVRALTPLENAEFGGWVCVEREPVGETERTPRQSATTSRDVLREHLHW